MVSLTAVFLKDKHGYTGFVEELPGVNSHGHTIDEERAQSEELLVGKDVVREQFQVSIPRN
jgi:predicted RNase H-like HicB family nuclease